MGGEALPFKTSDEPDHPFSQFSIGSLETLDGDVYSDLMTFFEEHYSADQMSAVVLHKEPLETLVPWVKALFSDVAAMIEDQSLLRLTSSSQIAYR